jgi:dihydrofolate reductase
VTSNKTYGRQGCIITHSFQEGLDIARIEYERYLQNNQQAKGLFIIGGSDELLRQALRVADYLCLTKIDSSFPEADRFFPKEYGELFNDATMSCIRNQDPDGTSYYCYVLRKKK